MKGIVWDLVLTVFLNESWIPKYGKKRNVIRGLLPESILPLQQKLYHKHVGVESAACLSRFKYWCEAEGFSAQWFSDDKNILYLTIRHSCPCCFCAAQPWSGWGTVASKTWAYLQSLMHWMWLEPDSYRKQSASKYLECWWGRLQWLSLTFCSLRKKIAVVAWWQVADWSEHRLVLCHAGKATVCMGLLRHCGDC